MSAKSRKEVLEQARQRYGKRGRGGRSRLLDEVCELCGYERKYAIKVLSSKRAIIGSNGRKRGGSQAIYPAGRAREGELAAGRGPGPSCANISHRTLGCERTRIYRGRHSDALRAEYGRRLLLELDSDRCAYAVDGNPRGVQSQPTRGRKAHRRDEAALPYAIQGFDTDNGARFLNWHLRRTGFDEPTAVFLLFRRTTPL